MLKISNVIKGWKVFLGNNWKCLTTTTEHLTNLQNWFITWTHFSSVRVICYFRKCSRPGNWREQQRSVVYSTEWVDSLLDNLVHGFFMIGWITLGLSLSIARTLTIILCEVGKHYKQGGAISIQSVSGVGMKVGVFLLKSEWKESRQRRNSRVNSVELARIASFCLSYLFTVSVGIVNSARTPMISTVLDI